jgi:hypothetical protein
MRATLIAALAASTVLPSSAAAQLLRRDPTVRNCNLAEQAYDNPFSDGSGWTMRRYQWHIFYAGLTSGAAYGIHKVTHLPPWASAAIATVGIGLVPHIRGYANKTYGINVGDWTFDLWTRGAPALAVAGGVGDVGSTRSRILAGTTYLAGYAALACYASP